MEIGQKLKDKRASLGLSQEELAEKIGVTRQTIANWEKGKTYPDIGSVMKLSDLYNVSLDELLKEDAAMRKHTEDAAALPRKYWNILFEVALLLLPLGLLVAYWGFGPVGLGIQIIGLLMMPPLWVAKYRLFGMSKEDLKYSLIGWALYSGSAVVDALAGEQVLLLLIPLVMQLIGMLMVYRHGIELERGTRFWLVIFLYFGIPAFVMGSGMLGLLADQSAFTAAQPFGHQYRIAQVEVGTPENPNAIIELRSFPLTMAIDGERVGFFETVALTDHQKQASKGIWHLVPEENPNVLYKLEVNVEDKMTLSYLVEDQLQWRWVLSKIPTAILALHTPESLESAEMEWFNAGTYSGDPAEVTSFTFSGEATAYYLQCNFEGVTKLTLVEEYHHDEKTETREFHLEKDKNGNFPIPEAPAKRYDSGVQFILYRLQWDGGEYLLCVKLK